MTDRTVWTKARWASVRVRVGPAGVVAASLGRLAVAEEVGGNDGESLRQRRHHCPPGGRAEGKPVNEHHRRSLARHAIADGVAVELEVADGETAGRWHEPHH